MKEFPPGIQFKYPWRSYQERVLSELNAHLSDKHLHIIAPPGSGKTVLGLEVAVRLNKPTLIFAPTIAIRNQWIHSFCESFIQTTDIPDWISKDIRVPKFLTVSTYQGLHAVCTRGETETIIDVDDLEEEEPQDSIDDFSNKKAREIVKALRNQGVATIIVDEAHHLKNAWWESLIEIKQGLNPTVVGLTATPPYDVTYAEWNRYIELNGPVDAEISVPELVVEGNLCPHQDYVLFSFPSKTETHKIQEHQNRIKRLFEDIKGDEVLISALKTSPFFIRPDQQLDWIYTHLEYYSSILVFLNAVDVPILPIHKEVIGNKKFKIPALNYEWMEVLLGFYLYGSKGMFASYEEHKVQLINKLKRNSAVERKTISFRNNRNQNKLLSSSISKLDSIVKICEFESSKLGSDLRAVVLTDYIRKEFLIQDTVNDLPITKIGVIPIFETLRRNAGLNAKLGVLSGSIIILPTSAIAVLKEMCGALGISEIKIRPVAFDASYQIIYTSEKLKSDIVQIVTRLFQAGYIEILIGTKSLLGEGWDAPAINTLILASFVGSYVSSNQMRGRAIRTYKEDPNKTGNIWHLVCLDTINADGGEDFRLLQRRFKAFVGIALQGEDRIENGIARLALPSDFTTYKTVAQTNEMMFAISGKRERLKQAWDDALKSGKILVEEVKIPFEGEQGYHERKTLYLNKTIAYLISAAVALLIAFSFILVPPLIQNIHYLQDMGDVFLLLMIFGNLAVVIFGSMAFKVGRLYIKYRDISKDILYIGRALLETLIEQGKITTGRNYLMVVANQDELGTVFCRLEGGTTFERSLFIKCLMEIIEPVRNPRYLMIRKSTLLGVFDQKDYHSVPEILGKHKNVAQSFASKWRAHVGACALVFTRNITGRKLLLKARMNSLASEFEEKTERINNWK